MRLLRFALLSLVFLSPALLPGQQATSSSGVPVSMVVTAEARHGAQVPAIGSQDVLVFVKHERARVTEWVPLQGARAGAQLFLLIDDAASTALGSQLEDLRQFILGQPATTQIGVAYMQNGAAMILENLTTDHALAANALRLPLSNAGASASPYFSLGDLIKRWPEARVPRLVLMVTDGIDRYWGSGPDDPYVDSAIDQALKAGVVVFSIYMPSSGHLGHSYWRINWGQNYLSRLSDETGGESYYIGFGAPVAFSPYLEDLARKLERQYWVTFLAPPEKKAGFQRVMVKTEVPNVDLISPDRVHVPAGQ